jgi:hypothetical protein
MCNKQYEISNSNISLDKRRVVSGWWRENGIIALRMKNNILPRYHHMSSILSVLPAGGGTLASEERI